MRSIPSRELPRKPKPVVVTLGGVKYEVVLEVDVFTCKSLTPRSDNEAALHQNLGPMVRITWCHSTYDQALAKGIELLDRGHPPMRLEFLRADKEELEAYRSGYFHLVPVKS